MIAVLLACFNRKEKTLRCLESLYKQAKEQFDVYLCDDGSTDGTAESVSALYPKVHIYQGGGLFWNRGMLAVMKEATRHRYNYYLMVNDDVDFFDTMLDTMTSFYLENKDEQFAVVGSTCDCDGNITYGGRLCLTAPLSYGNVIEPNGAFQACDVANWNCFLLPQAVIDKVGLLDEIYEHGFGDYDYCYRLKQNDIPIYVAPNCVGQCETNNKVNPLNDINIPRKKRLEILFSNKGIPVKSWYVYTKRYGGRKWRRHFAGPYIKYCIKILLNRPIN